MDEAEAGKSGRLEDLPRSMISVSSCLFLFCLFGFCPFWYGLVQLRACVGNKLLYVFVISRVYRVDTHDILCLMDDVKPDM